MKKSCCEKLKDSRVASLVKPIDGFFKKIDDWIHGFFHKHDIVIFLVLISLLALVPRMLTMNNYSGDYNPFLKPWYDAFVANGYNAAGYAASNNNYPPFYMTFIGFLSIFKLNSTAGNPAIVPTYLYALKIFDFFFEFVAAVFAYKIVKKLTNGKFAPAIAYAVLLFLPTVFANSALWDQCDIIYGCFLLISLYYFIGHKPGWAMVFFGFAFANKLQAVFFLPVILVFFLKRDLKFRYFFYIPIVYFITMIPSLICGIPFGTMALVYIKQAGFYSALNMSIANFSSFFANVGVGVSLGSQAAAFFTFLIVFAVALAFALAFTFYKLNKHVLWDTKNIIKISYLFALIVPYFLPAMHDRYYFVADLFALLYVFTNPKKFYIAVVTTFVSLLGYIHWLTGINLISPFGDSGFNNIDNRIGATVMGVMIILLLLDIFEKKNNVETQLTTTLDHETSETAPATLSNHA